MSSGNLCRLLRPMRARFLRTTLPATGNRCGSGSRSTGGIHPARGATRGWTLSALLERFGPTGGWREAYRDGRSIDDSSTLRDGAEVGGFAGLLNALAERRDDVYRQLCEQLLGYALGRSILTSDRGLIGEMVAEIDENGGHFSALVAKIVASPQFRFRRGAGGDRSPTIELNRSETEAGRDGPTNDERP